MATNISALQATTLRSRALFRTFCLLFLVIAPAALRAAVINVPANQPTIQAGINAANPGDTVLVAPGTYFENINFNGKAITVTSSGGAANTIIDGGGVGPAVAFTTGETRSSVISGFTIQHGGIPNLFYGDAGIYINTGSPTIVNNVLTHNICSSIDIEGGSPLIQSNNINNTDYPSSYCRFAGGSAVWVNGASQSLPTTPPAILGNVIENNTQSATDSGGAGIAVWGGNPVIQNNIIRNNKTLGVGGGIDLVSGGATIVQNLIYANNAAGAGGLVFHSSTEQTFGPVSGYLINNTIVNNTITGQNTITGNFKSSQVYLYVQTSEVALVNNIIVGPSNTPLVICDPTYEVNSFQDIIFDHNDVYNSQGPLYGGTCTDKTGTFGNISANPSFVNPSTNDFHLSAASPAIDAGNNSAWYLPQQDFDGNPRESDFSGKGYPVIDMGAYEHAGQQDANATLITLVPSAYVVNAGDPPLTLSSQLISAGGIPTGSVIFSEDGNIIGTTVIDASGRATLSSVPLTLGLHSFLATYSGQGAFPSAVSVVTFVFVHSYQQSGTGATSTALTSSSASPSFGQPVTFTATVSSLTSGYGAPTGTVTFSDGSTVLATQTLASTSATAAATAFTTSSLAPGTHTITATYAPTGNFSASTTTLSQTVNGTPTTSTLVPSQNPAPYGHAVVFTVTVTAASSTIGAPTGAVTLTSGGTTVLGTQTLTPSSSTVSTASFSINSLAIGNYAIQASYNATGAFVGSTAAITETIQSLSTTTILTATPNPAYALQPVTLTASVSTGTASIATGTVTFFDGATTLGTATLDATGHATFITSILTTGTHSLHAVYSGDTSFATSTSNNIAVTININPTTTTLSITPTPSQAFQFFTVNFSIASLTNVSFTPQSCNPACTITLNVTGLPNNQNSTVTAPVLANGTSPFRYALGTGTYTFTATFNGSPTFASSTSTTVTQIVVPATTTLTLAATPNPAVQNQSVAFTSSLTAPLSTEIPNGTITLLDGATPFATAPFSGSPLSNTATITAATAALAPGTHTITATYPGDPNSNFLPSTSTSLTLIIKPNDYTLTTSTPNPTIPTEHHLAIPLNLTSIGTFADQVTLTCSTLPAWATCTFDQSTLQLTAAGTATTNLTIDTSSVLGYIARNQTPKARTSITLALTFPAGILGLFLTRRRKLPLRLTLFVLTTLAATLTLTGCTGMIPLSTPPGTYTFNITAHGATTGLTHTLPITLTVTSE